VFEIVEPIDPLDSSPAPIGSFLVSLLVHGLLVVGLWWLVYTTARQQTIILMASSSESAGDVTLELASKGKQVQPLVVVDQFTPVDLIAAKKSLIAGSMKADARSPSRNFEPAQINFFGTRAFGARFVFVLDISYSMDAREGERFRRARDELLRSVSDLKQGQSYYVFLFCWETKKMFYNRSVEYVEVAPGHVQKLHDWIHTVSLGAGTDPRRALALAKEMRPDAVFLLSDGHFNKPNWPRSDAGWIDARGEPFKAEVQEGVDLFYRDTSIHTIAFENPFALAAMQAIADATGGNCRYIKTETYRPVDSKRFLTALLRIDQIRRHQSRRRQEYQRRLSYARDFIGQGELVYAEYLVRPLRHAEESLITNKTLLTRVLTVLDAELGELRLEDFESAPELGEVLGTLR
jgi:Mg-chelatase subunit ChlD